MPRRSRTPAHAPVAVRKPDAPPTVRTFAIETDPAPQPVVFEVPGLPNAQDAFLDLCRANFEDPGWSAFTDWASKTSFARLDFCLAATDWTATYILRDFQLSGGWLDFSTLAVKYGTCSCPKKPCSGKCGTLRSDKAAFDMVSSWVVGRGGLDSNKGREIMTEHSPRHLGEFDEIWRKVFQIAAVSDNAVDRNQPGCFGV